MRNLQLTQFAGALVIALAAVIGASTVGCGGDNSPSPNTNPTVADTGTGTDTGSTPDSTTTAPDSGSADTSTPGDTGSVSDSTTGDSATDTTPSCPTPSTLKDFLNNPCTDPGVVTFTPGTTAGNDPSCKGPGL
jgi:hypothetical protein